MSGSTYRTSICDKSLPSYQESVTAAEQEEFNNSKRSHGTVPSLLDRIANTRARRINEVITDFIDPALASMEVDAAMHQTVVLLPSDLSGRSLSPSEMVAPAMPGSVRMIHLKGEDHRASFWEQPNVITEFERALRIRLGSQAASDMRTDEPSTRISNMPSSRRVDRDPTGTTGRWYLGWRVDSATVSASEQADGIVVSAKLREMSVRTESDLGLWQTETFKSIWVMVDIIA